MSFLIIISGTQCYQTTFTHIFPKPLIIKGSYEVAMTNDLNPAMSRYLLGTIIFTRPFDVEPIYYLPGKLKHALDTYSLALLYKTTQAMRTVYSK